MVKGSCNCGSVTVELAKLPDQSAICSCANCKRAGSAPFSIVYILDKSEVDIKDPNGALKSYEDKNTKSGNTLVRQFCDKCGSPVSSLLGPEAPKIIIKAGLFDQVPAPGHAVFQEGKPEWVNVTEVGKL